MMNTEDGGLIRTSVVQNLPAQEEASCNENDESVMSDEVSSTTETPAVRHLLRTIITEDSGSIRTPVVWNLSAQEEVSCNGLWLRHSVQQGLQQKNVVPVTMNTTDTMNTEDSSFTGISAVWNLPAQEASCVMLKEISDATEAHTVQCLSAQEASCYSVRGPRYAEPQQHSIKNSSADTEAINSDASHISISL